MMQNAIRHIFLSGLCMVCISILYFLLLVLHMPVVIIVPVTAVCLWLLVKIYLKYIPATPDHKNSIITIAILIAGLVYLCWNIYQATAKYGEWDAWAIWNYHALCLTDGQHWTNMFASATNDHPDYPLFLPALLGFFMRFSNNSYFAFIPVIVHIFITICIPVLLFSRLAVKNIIIAAVVLWLIVSDKFFVLRGVSQYADTALAFFFLCAIIAMDKTKEDKYYVTISAAFLGACMWTKNEGAVLAVLFFLFYTKSFFSKQHIKYTAIGIAAPLACLLLFKIMYAPANDMVTGLHESLLTKAMDKQRYHLIYTYFINNINNSFHYLKVIFIVYLCYCAWQKRLPLNFIMVLCCLLCYMGFYVFTSQDLDWHLGTSQDRLMHQLMPAVLYIFMNEIAQTRWFAPFNKSVA